MTGQVPFGMRTGSGSIKGARRAIGMVAILMLTTAAPLASFDLLPPAAAQASGDCFTESFTDPLGAAWLVGHNAGSVAWDGDGSGSLVLTGGEAQLTGGWADNVLLGLQGTGIAGKTITFRAKYSSPKGYDQTYNLILSSKSELRHASDYEVILGFGGANIATTYQDYKVVVGPSSATLYRGGVEVTTQPHSGAQWVFWMMGNEDRTLHLDDIAACGGGSGGGCITESFSDPLDPARWLVGHNAGSVAWDGDGSGTLAVTGGEAQLTGGWADNVLLGLQGTGIAGKTITFRAKYSSAKGYDQTYQLVLSSKPQLRDATGYEVVLNFGGANIATTYQDYKVVVGPSSATLYRGGVELTTQPHAGAQWAFWMMGNEDRTLHLDDVSVCGSAASCFTEFFTDGLDPSRWVVGHNAGSVLWDDDGAGSVAAAGGEAQLTGGWADNALLGLIGTEVGGKTITFRAKYSSSKGYDQTYQLVLSSKPRLRDATGYEVVLNFGGGNIATTYQDYKVVVGPSSATLYRGGAEVVTQPHNGAKWAFWMMGNEDRTLHLDDLQVCGTTVVPLPDVPAFRLGIDNVVLRPGDFNIQAQCYANAAAGSPTNMPGLFCYEGGDRFFGHACSGIRSTSYGNLGCFLSASDIAPQCAQYSKPPCESILARDPTFVRGHAAAQFEATPFTDIAETLGQAAAEAAAGAALGCAIGAIAALPGCATGGTLGAIVSGLTVAMDIATWGRAESVGDASWGARGGEYAITGPVCAEQKASHPATLRVTYSLRGKLRSEASGTDGTVAQSSIELSVVGHYPSATRVPVALGPEEYTRTATAVAIPHEWVVSNPSVLHQGPATDKPSLQEVTVSPGRYATYMTMMAFAGGSIPWTGGQIRASADGLSPGHGLDVTSIELLWKQDLTPPILPASPFDGAVTGTLGPNGWYTSPVTVVLRATDPETCVKEFGYTLDGAAGTLPAATPTLTISDQKAHTLSYTASNHQGRSSSTGPVAIKLDWTAPTTEPRFAPPSLKGNEDWWLRADVALDCSDNASQCMTTTWVLDGGMPQRGNLVRVGDGFHKLTFWSEDHAGNREAARTIEFKVDGTPPETFVNVPAPTGENGWHTGPVRVATACADVLSGCDDPAYFNHVTRSFGLLERGRSADFTLWTEGDNLLSVIPYDKAGNAGGKMVGMRIDRTPPTSWSTVEPNGANGWFTREPDIPVACGDGPVGSGCAVIEWRVTEVAEPSCGSPVNDPAWQRIGGSSGTIPVRGEGLRCIEYRAKDRAGWWEGGSHGALTHRELVKIDLNDPSNAAAKFIGVQLDRGDTGLAAGGVVAGSVEVQVRSDDPGTGSGLTGLWATVDGREVWRTTYPAPAFGDGRTRAETFRWQVLDCQFGQHTHAVEVGAQDAAGRIGRTTTSVTRLDCGWNLPGGQGDLPVAPTVQGVA